MNPHNDKPIDRILHDLQERAKELNCLYRVDELLGREEAPLDEVLGEVIRTVPAGWQFPDVCVARIDLGNRAFEPAGFSPSPFKMVSLIEAQGEVAGQVEVYYTEAMPRAAEGPFLAEERKLLDAIAERLGHFVSRRRLRRVLAADGEPGAATPEWWVVLDFLRQTDRALLARLGRKMINHLCWNGFDDAERLLRSTVPARTSSDGENFDENRPAAPDRAGRRPRDDGSRIPDRREQPARGRDPQLHPELDQGGQVHLPQERARAHGHAARGAGRRAPALPPRRGSRRATSRPPPRSASARRSCGAS